MRLSTRLISIYAAIAVVALPVTGYLTYRRVFQDTHRVIRDNIGDQMTQIDEVLTLFLKSIENDLNMLAADPAVRHRDDGSFTSFLDTDEESFVYEPGAEERAIVELFANYRDNHPYANSVYMGRENGSFVRSHERARNTRYDPRERPWYRLALSEPGAVLRTAPYRSVTTDDINVGTVKALLDGEGRPFGVVGIDVTLKGLTDFVSRLQIGDNGYILLLDEDHRIITRVFQNQLDEFLKSGVDLFAESVKGKGVYELEDLYLFYARSPFSRWVICSVLPAGEINDKVKRAVIFAVGWMSAVLIVVTVLTAIGIRRFIVRPTQTLERTIDGIVSTESLSEEIPLKGDDEIGRLARSFQTMMARLKESFRDKLKLEKANSQLTRYFSPSVAREIIQAEADFLKPGGRTQEVVVLFSDIRGFTTISERISPDDVLELLSRYHRIMVDIIFRHGGTLDKFIGDGLMATFGTPTAGEDDVLRSVRAALEMKRASPKVQAKVKDILDAPLRYGIGLHIGNVIVGNVGTEDRLEYTVIGDPVNTASRIESACKTLGEDLLISEAVRSRVEDQFDFRFVTEISLKGKAEKIRLYTVEAEK